MRILLTGATGFIGRHLLRALAGKHELGVILRETAKAEKLGEVGDKVEKVSWTGDGEELKKQVAAFRPDAVIHLASFFTGEHKGGDIDPLIESNVRFPAHVAEAAAACGCGIFINTGSSMQHEDNAAFAPMNLYAATKQAFADILAAFVRPNGIRRAVTLELSDTYGPGDDRPKLLPLLRQRAGTAEGLALSPGGQFVDFVHIDDVVQAFEVALTYARAGKDGMIRAFAVRSGAPCSLKEIVTLFNECSPKQVSVDWGKRPYRAKEFFKPWTSGETLPGWSPKIKLADGLRDLVKGEA